LAVIEVRMSHHRCLPPTDPHHFLLFVVGLARKTENTISTFAINQKGENSQKYSFLHPP
jgi:hypothetical protein